MSDIRYKMVDCVCPTCGKAFVPSPEHVYKEDYRLFCKWSCLCAYRKEHRKNEKFMHKYRRKYTKEQEEDAVRKIVEEGNTINGTAKKLGISVNTLYGWVQRYKDRKNMEQQGW